MLEIIIEFKCILGKLEFLINVIGNIQTDSLTLSLFRRWLKYIFTNGTYYWIGTLLKNKDLKAKVKIVARIGSM